MTYPDDRVSTGSRQLSCIQTRTLESLAVGRRNRRLMMPQTLLLFYLLLAAFCREVLLQEFVPQTESAPVLLAQPEDAVVAVLPPANTLDAILLDDLAPAAEPTEPTPLAPFTPEDAELYFGEGDPETQCACGDEIPPDAFSCQEIVYRHCLITLLKFLLEV